MNLPYPCFFSSSKPLFEKQNKVPVSGCIWRLIKSAAVQLLVKPLDRAVTNRYADKEPIDSDTDDEPGSPRIKKSRCRCTEDSGEDKSAFNEPPPAASASDDTCMHTDEDDGPHKDDASLLQFVCSMSSLGVNPYLLELQKNQHHLLWDIDDFVWKLTNANSFSEQPGKHPLMAPQDLNLAIIPFQETKLGLEDVVAKLTDYKDARGELEGESEPVPRP